MGAVKSDQHTCDKCSFVPDIENIYIDPKILQKVGYEPILVGIFTMTDWVGCNAFYVFKCKDCGRVSIDYPHGYTEDGLIFLRCRLEKCGEILPLEPKKNRDIYESAAITLPSASWWQRRRELKKIIKDVQEEKGIVIITRQPHGFFARLRRLISAKGGSASGGCF